MEEGVVPSSVVIDVRVVVIRRVIEEVVAATVAGSSPAKALGGADIVVSVGHRGTAVVLPLPTVAVVAAAAMGMAIVVIVVVVGGAAASATLALVAAGYDVPHADAAPR